MRGAKRTFDRGGGGEVVVGPGGWRVVWVIHGEEVVVVSGYLQQLIAEE